MRKNKDSWHNAFRENSSNAADTSGVDTTYNTIAKPNRCPERTIKGLGLRSKERTH